VIVVSGVTIKHKEYKLKKYDKKMHDTYNAGYLEGYESALITLGFELKTKNNRSDLIKIFNKKSFDIDKLKKKAYK